MSKNLTVVKKAGHLIAAGYLERVIKNQRQYLGAAIAGDGHIVLEKARTAPTLDLINQIQETFKDQPIVFAFGDDKSVSDKDMQPFAVCRDGETITAALCLDGEFDRHKKPEQPMTGEYQAAITIGKYLEKFSKHGGIAEELEDELNQQIFQNLWNNRGAMTVLLADGYCKTIQEGNNQSGEYSWGYASNAYGWMENVGDAIKAEPAKEMTLAEKLKAKMLGSTALKESVVEQPATTPPADENNAPAATPEAPTVPSEGDLTGCTLVKPDNKTYDTKRKRKDWYEKRLGYAPNGFNSGNLALVKYPDGHEPQYKLADSKSFELLKAMKTTPTAATTQPVTGPQPQPQTAVQQQPSIDSGGMTALERKKALMAQQGKSDAGKVQAGIKEVGGSQTKTALTNPSIADKALPVTSGVSAEQLPIISPEAKKKINEVLFKKTEFQGLLGENFKEIIDPRRLAEISKKLPTFAEAFPEQFPGGSMNGFNTWELNHFHSLGQTDIKALATAAFWINVDRMRLEMRIQQAIASGLKIAV